MYLAWHKCVWLTQYGVKLMRFRTKYMNGVL